MKKKENDMKCQVEISEAIARMKKVLSETDKVVLDLSIEEVNKKQFISIGGQLDAAILVLQSAVDKYDV
jgi:hypothetical protein